MKPNTRRVFVALGISTELQAVIADWQRGFSALPVRWLAGKNLHITLVPPWEETDIELARLALRSLRDKFTPFTLKFHTVTFGPTPTSPNPSSGRRGMHSPRLIWAEGNVSNPLLSLKTTLEQAFSKAPENRLFRLHLTLARFRPERFSSFSVKKLEERVDWCEEARSVLLIESHLLPQGAEYEVLEEVRLE